MPVEYLSDEQVAAYGRFAGPPTRTQLERSFLLNDADRGLVHERRRDHTRLGLGVQLGTVRLESRKRENLMSGSMTGGWRGAPAPTVRRDEHPAETLGMSAPTYRHGPDQLPTLLTALLGHLRLDGHGLRCRVNHVVAAASTRAASGVCGAASRPGSSANGWPMPGIIRRSTCSGA
jgi:Domain of unknown function (DUF4158)